MDSKNSQISYRILQLLLGIILALFLLFQLSNHAHAQRIGGACEGCEGVYEYGQQVLTATDTFPEFEQHQSQLYVTGTVFQADGQTPAAGVILYAYHTNREGIYPKKGNEKGMARRHGYLRAWVKTNANGQYSFYTFKPGSYPSRTEPAHIHLIVKEPGLDEYWIDSIEFEDDPLLTATMREGKRQRGGNGIVRLRTKGGMLLAQRDIVLGKNIPNYTR